MRNVVTALLLLLVNSYATGQETTHWYSETVSNGIVIQNSYPKGGPYTGPTERFYNYSYLVFYTRIINESDDPLEVNLYFSGDEIEIPKSPKTYVKLFLPQDTMTLDKRDMFSYGVTELESLDTSTSFHRLVNPTEDCLFYVVAVFYQKRGGERIHNRGGNRAELLLEGQDLFYNMTPQIDSLFCGNIILHK